MKGHSTHCASNATLPTTTKILSSPSIIDWPWSRAFCRQALFSLLFSLSLPRRRLLLCRSPSWHGRNPWALAWPRTHPRLASMTVWSWCRPWRTRIGTVSSTSSPTLWKPVRSSGRASWTVASAGCAPSPYRVPSLPFKTGSFVGNGKVVANFWSYESLDTHCTGYVVFDCKVRQQILHPHHHHHPPSSSFSLIFMLSFFLIHISTHIADGPNDVAAEDSGRLLVHGQQPGSPLHI